MAIVAQRNLKSNSNDSVWWFNWTDTSIDYNNQWPFNWSAQFNASWDKVTVANNSAFNITTWSILMRVNTSLSWSYAYLMCKNNNNPTNDNFFYAIWPVSNNGKPSFYNWARRTANTAINDSKWHLVAIWATTWNSDFWLDGKLDATVAYNLFIATWTASSLYIWHRDVDSRNLNWFISRARFYNHKIVASEVKNEYALWKWFYSW